MSKAKQATYNSSSGNVVDVDEDEEESDSYVGQEDEEDDYEIDEEEEESESQEEEYEYDESESDPEGNVESDGSSDEDEEYESISDDGSNDDDDDKGCDRKERKPTDKDLCDKVVNLLRQRNKKLDVLKLEECKAYLRKHQLMISGTKATCIRRILEHWRLKDGNGERLYPKSSFTINCTGDVCKGDVVMFKQRVYNKFNTVSRNGKVIGKRTIAGRVVKESYGRAKQQHTFTVEVLWSKGVKALPLLYPLLVKGRNLYRYRTFRQWGNEAERSKILEEKHRRGATARHVRASTKARISAGSKRQRTFTDSKPHQIKRLKKHSEAPTPSKKQKNTHNTKALVTNHSKNFKTIASSSTNMKQTDHFRRTSFQNIYENSQSYFHQRDRFLIPVHNYNHGEINIRQSHSVYDSQFDRTGRLSHPYPDSISPYDSTSSGRFFAPGAYDQRYVGFQFHGRSQPWP